jgi:UV DNA damage endonuclease
MRTRRNATVRRMAPAQNDKLASYDDPSVPGMLLSARSTWTVPEHQLVHISNGRSGFNDRQHADLIEVMPSSYRQAPWIEIEAKNKEEAIRNLQAWKAG